jgi:hypothetical protein
MCRIILSDVNYKVGMRVNLNYSTEGIPRKLATEISKNCCQTELNTYKEWSSANWENGNTTRGKTEKLNIQATEHASLLAIALQCGFILSAVL